MTQKFLSSMFGVCNKPGKATAYRFVAFLDGEIIGVEFQDFATDNDFVEDYEIEELDQNFWSEDAFNESRFKECRSAVSEYIKTTDEPETSLVVYDYDFNPWQMDIVEK